MADFLGRSSRWLVLVALVYAPWALGSTTPRTLAGLYAILGAALGSWIISLGLHIRAPAVSPWLIGLCVALLGLIAWTVFDSHSLFDPESGRFVPIRPVSRSLAGSVDYAISSAWLLRATLLLGALCLVAEATGDLSWIMRCWWVVVLTGGSIALFGLIQKATGDTMLFHVSDPRSTASFFATFYYHANAGAYLNLVLPLSIGLSVRMMLAPASGLARAAACSAALLIGAATLANTSRGAQAVTVILLLVTIAWAVRALVRGRASFNSKTLVVAGLVAVIAIAAVAQASHLDRPLRRWQSLGEHLGRDSRSLAARAALGAFADAGPLGFGAGTFRVVFPFYTAPYGKALRGSWRFLHNDYLQTLIEFGWIGSGLWLAILAGGGVIALANSRGRGAKAWRPRHRTLLPPLLFALAGVAVHAIIDFPLQIASLQLYVAVFCGMAWGTSRWNAPPPMHD